MTALSASATAQAAEPRYDLLRNEGCVSLSISFAHGEISLDDRTWTLTPKD